MMSEDAKTVDDDPKIILLRERRLARRFNIKNDRWASQLDVDRFGQSDKQTFESIDRLLATYSHLETQKHDHIQNPSLFTDLDQQRVEGINRTIEYVRRSLLILQKDVNNQHEMNILQIIESCMKNTGVQHTESEQQFLTQLQVKHKQAIERKQRERRSDKLLDIHKQVLVLNSSNDEEEKQHVHCPDSSTRD